MIAPAKAPAANGGTARCGRTMRAAASGSRGGNAMNESTSNTSNTSGTSTNDGSAGSGRTVASGRGIEWWSEAWKLFVKAAGMWIVLAIILILIMVVLNFIPVLGQVAVAVLLPVFIGSWMIAARKVENDGALELSDLFTAIHGDKVVPLLILGALMLAFAVAIFLVAGLLG